MVNADRVKRKLPSLLVDGCSNRNKKEWNAYKRYLYRYDRFKTKNPGLYNTLANDYVAVLEKIEKAVNSYRCKK